MKVCHLTSVHPAEDIRILIKECQSLQRAGHDVSLIVANTHDRDYNGVHIIGVESMAKNRLFKMVKTPYRVYKEALRVNADVYHFHDPELMPIGLRLKSKGKKVIYDVHEDVPEQVLSKQWIPRFLRKGISIGVEKVEKFASKRFDAVITATPTISSRFITYNPNTKTVHNFPILNELLSDGSDSAETYKKENNILYIGGITALRGIKEMIQSIDWVNQHVSARLVLAGTFAPPQLKDEMEKLPGWDHVDYLGWLNREEVKEHLSKAKMGLVNLHPEPRYVVSYPIKLFEYMSAGIPVIASNFPLWKSIVEENNCGKCVDPLNPNEIAEMIEWFINHPEEAKQMGENGRKAIVEKYSWENEAKTLEALYASL